MALCRTNAGSSRKIFRRENSKSLSLPSRTKKVVPDDAVLVSVEGFLLEVAEESWVELSCLVLSDAARKIQLTTYTQSTPVDPAFVAAAKSATPGTRNIIDGLIKCVCECFSIRNSVGK